MVSRRSPGVSELVVRQKNMSDESDVNDSVEVLVPDFRELLDDGRRVSLAVTVKHNGKWRFHKSDADTVFPSDFHAHRLDEAEKLDMYTGYVWSATTNKMLYRMPKKAMRYMFDQLEEMKQEFLDAKMSNRSKFSFLGS